jgi:hypothetical protein
VQVIAYAGRVLQLASRLFGERAAALEQQFVARLAEAKSNVPEQQDGASIYNRLVRPLQVGLEQVAAHYAISSIFTSYAEEAAVFSYTVRRLAYEAATSGRVRLIMGQGLVASTITEAAQMVEFAVLHLGDQNMTAAVKGLDGADAEERARFTAGAKAAVTRADFPAVVRSFDRYFGGQTYSIQSLFRDEQKRILEILLRGTIAEVESSLTAIYESQASLLHFLTQTGLPRPEALTTAATFAINAGVRRALESEPIDALQVRSWLELAQADQIALDRKLLSYLADQKMRGAMGVLHENPTDAQRLDAALLAARTLRELPFDLNLWQAQNLWYEAFRHIREHPPAFELLEKWKELGRQMKISVDQIVAEDGNGTQEAARSPRERGEAGVG